MATKKGKGSKPEKDEEIAATSTPLLVRAKPPASSPEVEFNQLLADIDRSRSPEERRRLKREAEEKHEAAMKPEREAAALQERMGQVYQGHIWKARLLRFAKKLKEREAEDAAAGKRKVGAEKFMEHVLRLLRQLHFEKPTWFPQRPHSVYGVSQGEVEIAFLLDPERPAGQVPGLHERLSEALGTLVAEGQLEEPLPEDEERWRPAKRAKPFHPRRVGAPPPGYREGRLGPFKLEQFKADFPRLKNVKERHARRLIQDGEIPGVMRASPQKGYWLEKAIVEALKL